MLQDGSRSVSGNPSIPAGMPVFTGPAERFHQLAVNAFQVRPRRPPETYRP